MVMTGGWFMIDLPCFTHITSFGDFLVCIQDSWAKHFSHLSGPAMVKTSKNEFSKMLAA
jgi:hypothetical protein